MNLVGFALIGTYALGVATSALVFPKMVGSVLKISPSLRKWMRDALEELEHKT